MTSQTCGSKRVYAGQAAVHWDTWTMAWTKPNLTLTLTLAGYWDLLRHNRKTAGTQNRATDNIYTVRGDARTHTHTLPLSLPPISPTSLCPYFISSLSPSRPSLSLSIPLFLPPFLLPFLYLPLSLPLSPSSLSLSPYFPPSLSLPPSLSPCSWTDLLFSLRPMVLLCGRGGASE